MLVSLSLDQSHLLKVLLFVCVDPFSFGGIVLGRSLGSDFHYSFKILLIFFLIFEKFILKSKQA